jgi:hypothetical protein
MVQLYIRFSLHRSNQKSGSRHSVPYRSVGNAFLPVKRKVIYNLRARKASSTGKCEFC